MELGFETIGNATLIAYDRGPILVTDPWIEGEPYFGSWTHSHEIPEPQRAAIDAAEFVWMSHGHPDHLDGASLPRFRERQILLPAHVGKRIYRNLSDEGYRVRELPTAKWVSLSDRIRVSCLPDYNQDACLLVDVGGTLLVNANDSSSRGWMPLIRRETARRSRSILLRLASYGDPEMINFFDESGKRIPPPAMKRQQAAEPIGPLAAELADLFGATHVVPFSAMHAYQREDSFWANECTTPLSAFERGFASDRATLLPPYLSWDLLRDDVRTIDPLPIEPRVRPASDFGDDWGESLEAEDVLQATRYFQAIEHLSTFLDYVNLRVGGRDNVLPIGRRSFRRGVTFECPRSSLMTAIRYEIFDDLLIGNFMKTSLHGAWPSSGLYPDFTPYVSKYADNGQVRTKAELREYFREYQRRTGRFDFLRHRLSVRGADVFRAHFSMDSPFYRMVKQAYWHFRQSG